MPEKQYNKDKLMEEKSVENKTNIVGFNRDYKFYLNNAENENIKGNYSKAIFYALKALNLAKMEDKIEIYFLLHIYYRNIHSMDNALYFGFKYMSLCPPSSYKRGKISNMIASALALYGHTKQSKYYYEQILAIPDEQKGLDQKNTDVLQSWKDNANTSLRTIKKESFTTVRTGKVENAAERIGDRFFREGNYDCAIEAYEKQCDLHNPQVRSQIILSYIGRDRNADKAMEILEKYGEDTIEDICIGLIVYDLASNRKKYVTTKNKLHPDSLDPTYLYKVAMLLITTSAGGEIDYALALKVIEKAFSYGILSTDFKYVYALTLFNFGDLKRAKEEFIDLKKYDIFNSAAYSYFLDLIERKDTSKQIPFSIGGLPELRNRFDKAIRLANIDDKNDLKKLFNENKDLFYHLRNMINHHLISALIKLDYGPVYDYLDYLLLSGGGDFHYLINVMLVYYYAHKTYIHRTIDGIYVEYSFFAPRIKDSAKESLLRLKNPKSFYMEKLSQDYTVAYNALERAYEYFVNNEPTMSVYFDFLRDCKFPEGSVFEGKCILEVEYDKQDTLKLASYIIYLVYKQNHKQISIDEIVPSRFTEEEFEAFLDKMGLLL